MAVDTASIASLLTTVTDALTSAAGAFPSDHQSLLTPPDGISLLDVKNGLLLSYLHNLVFLIILRLRDDDGTISGERGASKLNDEVVRKLIELRVYIERGVRPLEGRLRYQIDKVLRVAEESHRVAAQKQKQRTAGTETEEKKQRKDAKLTNGATENEYDSSEVSNAESISDDEDRDGDEDEDEEENEETIYRPNAAALAQRLKSDTNTTATKSQKSRSATTSTSKQGPYRPPRITPTTMPSLPSARSQNLDAASERDRRRRQKSNLLNEYIDEEMSATPTAQPSIGSNNTIPRRGQGTVGGGGMMSARDREKERERTEYEETNFVRLPGESKAERQKARLRGEGKTHRDLFGGEDWTGLGGLGDRINQSVQRGGGEKGGMSVLERREKRRRIAEDGQRGDGGGGIVMGDRFAKRQQVLEDRAERKRRRKV